MTIVNLFFFLIALAYSSAGFGGGSLYLAVLANTGLAAIHVRMLALSCNALVTLQGGLHYQWKKLIPWKKLWPLLAASVPASLLGAMIKMDDRWYFILLAICILLAAIAMGVQAIIVRNENRTALRNVVLVPASGVIGFLAGITGIGGGIFLSPLLYLTRWSGEKEIAAASSLFILLNSLAGLLGQGMVNGMSLTRNDLWFFAAVIAGGFIGSRLSVSVLTRSLIRWLTIGIMIFAAVRILIKYT
ncbi:MAG: sulfite exporter TauE/SafE family protein [Flavobacteriales bacterium]|nr:sulfite exporter TauE/SafE family protein [Flavobacteriales bacterium]